MGVIRQELVLEEHADFGALLKPVGGGGAYFLAQPSVVSDSLPKEQGAQKKGTGVDLPQECYVRPYSWEECIVLSVLRVCLAGCISAPFLFICYGFSRVWSWFLGILTFTVASKFITGQRVCTPCLSRKSNAIRPDVLQLLSIAQIHSGSHSEDGESESSIGGYSSLDSVGEVHVERDLRGSADVKDRFRWIEDHSPV